MGRAPYPVGDDEPLIEQCMQQVAVDGLAQRDVTTLSGGELARTVFARVLAQTTQVVLLDEPTAALDLRHQEVPDAISLPLIPAGLAATWWVEPEAILIHAAAAASGAGAIWLLKRDDSPFIARHAREAVNFNLSMLIYAAVACGIAAALVGLTVLTLGLGVILTLPAGLALLMVIVAIALMWLVCSIIAAVRAWNGEEYRYPLTIRLLD